MILVPVTLALAALPARMPTHFDIPTVIGPLHNPLVFTSRGRVGSVRDWDRRRKELEWYFEELQYGPMPRRAGFALGRPMVVRDGTCNLERREYALAVGRGRRIDTRMRLTLPLNATGRVPVVIRPLGETQDPGLYAARGYALAEFAPQDFARVDSKGERIGGVYDLFGRRCLTGVLMGQAWAYSEMVDILKRQPEIDADRVVVAGMGTAGKAALLAGAFDERIAVTAPLQAGTGGTAPYRYLHGECASYEEMMATSPGWFSPRFAQFEGQVDRMPFDQHELRALVAPRAQMSGEATLDDATNPQGSQIAYLAAKDVYRFLGAEDKLSIRFQPAVQVEPDRGPLDFADHVFYGRTLPGDFGRLPYPEEENTLSQ